MTWPEQTGLEDGPTLAFQRVWRVWVMTPRGKAIIGQVERRHAADNWFWQLTMPKVADSNVAARGCGLRRTHLRLTCELTALLLPLVTSDDQCPIFPITG